MRERRARRRGLTALALVVGAIGALPAAASADDHMLRVREVFTGANGAPNAQYVELQLIAGGHNNVTGNRVIVYDAAGDQVSLQAFPAALASNVNQRSVLIGTAAAAAFFGVPMDLVMPTASMSRTGGAVCYQDTDGPTANSFRDCVAWGTYSDVTPPDPVGTPFNAPMGGGIPVGKSMERDITGGVNPTANQLDDDTNDSAADFDEAFPSPRNNANAVTTTQASAFVGAGVLNFNSTEGVANRVSVEPSGAYYRITDEGGPVGVAAGCQRQTVNRVRCLQAPVTSLSGFTGNLNDVFSARTGLDTTIDGEEGADRLTTGAGEDTLTAGIGDDQLTGGADADDLLAGDGRDLVSYAERGPGEPVFVDLSDPAADGGAIDGAGDLLTNVETLRGGAGDDALTGDGLANTLTGGPGIDEMHGLGDNDNLMAKADGADDAITCGAGAKDVVFADLSDIYPTAGADACEIVK